MGNKNKLQTSNLQEVGSEMFLDCARGRLRLALLDSKNIFYKRTYFASIANLTLQLVPTVMHYSSILS